MRPSPTLPLAALLLLAAPLAAQLPAGSADPRLAQLIGAVSARRLESDLRTLVGFGTRHTLSDTLSPRRGIGAARRWIHAEFSRISQACGGCLEVRYVSEVFGNLPRVPSPVNVVSVIAIQRGAGDPDRAVLISGHFDSRISDPMNAVDSAPGANDDGSGTVAVIEAARVMSRQRFQSTVVYAALAGEEQSLLGGESVARFAGTRGWRVFNLNNDIVGNTSGGGGTRDTAMLRVFSDAVPPDESEAARIRRRTAGGEVDGPSRQLARYVQLMARRHVPALDVWLIYRLDRFGRGGDHREFSDAGFPAVRLTEGYENYTRQHQDIRVQNGVAYGDVLEGVDFNYLSKVTALNVASAASLAWAPAPPRQVRISGGGRYSTELSWQPPEDSAHVASYRVYWRRTDSPNWEHYRDAGRVTRFVVEGRIIDNWLFGVASVSAEGHESIAVFPVPGGN